jgi:nucleotidyltransferase/DNA polymerase involved in DNA repair
MSVKKKDQSRFWGVGGRGSEEMHRKSINHDGDEWALKKEKRSFFWHWLSSEDLRTNKGISSGKSKSFTNHSYHQTVN